MMVSSEHRMMKSNANIMVWVFPKLLSKISKDKPIPEAEQNNSEAIVKKLVILRK